MLSHAHQQKNLLLLFIFVFSSFTMTVVLTNQEMVKNGTSSTVTTINTSNTANTEVNTQISLANVFHSQSNSVFQKNVGQLGTETVKYYWKTPNFQISFLASQIEFSQVQPSTGKIINYFISFKGSNSVNPVALNKQESNTNYFAGTSHYTNVPAFKDVHYYNIYNGIDLHYYFTNQGLKYDFIVHPGANPHQISLVGSQNIFFTVHGSNLLIHNKNAGTLLAQDSDLLVYQQINAKTTKPTAQYILESNVRNVVSYKIGNYDASRDLIIDPVLVVNASTYLGGNDLDSGTDIVADSQKNVYIAGQVNSLDFPTVNPLSNSTHTSTTNTTIVVMKLNATGTGIMWSTYFGGSGNDIVSKIGLDGNNNVVLVGSTNSVDFPVTSSSQNSKLNGTQDAFIVVLSNDGTTIVLSSLLGGKGRDSIQGLYIQQGTENYFVTGTTTSENFTVTPDAFDKIYQNGTEYGYDAFLMKINNLGTIQYSTLLGGSGDDQGLSVGMDTQNNIYVMRSTNSNLTGLLHKGLDAFIMKFNSSLQFNQSKLIGGGFNDFPTSMAISNSDIYITGRTYSSDFPVNNTAFDNSTSGQTAFILKLNDTLGVLYSTFFGDGSIFPSKIRVDSLGQATIAGYTGVTNLPLKDAYRKTLLGIDGFITTFNDMGTNITYSTYIGGNGIDKINSFSLGDNNDLYLVGNTTSTDYPTFQAIQDSIANQTNADAFFTKLSKDYIAPTLTIKPDFEYHQGTTGNSLTFLASDNDPEATYVIYKNGSQEQSALLQPDKVSYSVDGLSIGVYNFTVLVKDRSGNYNMKTTLVTVLEALPTSSTTSTTSTATNTTTPINSTTSTKGSPNQLFQDVVIIVVLGVISAIASSVIVRNRTNKSKGQTERQEYLNQETTESQSLQPDTEGSSKDQQKSDEKPDFAQKDESQSGNDTND